jgi:hypothetical protein
MGGVQNIREVNKYEGVAVNTAGKKPFGRHSAAGWLMFKCILQE